MPAAQRGSVPGMTDVRVRAAGRLSEAFEYVERARGRLYDFHQLIGAADGRLDEVLELLTEAGEHELADTIRRDVLGRDVLEDRWTFQIVEEFDDGYYAAWSRATELTRAKLCGGERHAAEAEMKRERQAQARGHGS
jgi:hypothetical protein